MKKFTQPQILAQYKNQHIFNDKPCRVCGNNRYYTTGGKCVECQKAYTRGHVTPKTLMSNARGAIARAYRAELARCVAVRKTLTPVEKRRFPVITLTRSYMERWIVMNRGRCCAFCGTTSRLTMDVINPDLLPTWIDFYNLQLLCDEHKLGKYKSGLSDQAYRASAGIPSATEWDVI